MKKILNEIKLEDEIENLENEIFDLLEANTERIKYQVGYVKKTSYSQVYDSINEKYNDILENFIKKYGGLIVYKKITRNGDLFYIWNLSYPDGFISDNQFKILDFIFSNDEEETDYTLIQKEEEKKKIEDLAREGYRIFLNHIIIENKKRLELEEKKRRERETDFFL